MKTTTAKSLRVSKKEGVRKPILAFLKSLLTDAVFDAILIPMQVPAGDSYAWVLVKDPSLLDQANPLAPIMPVQGAKALKSLTRKGEGNLKIAAVMRPCEVRASVELAKLNQIHLESITLMSVDCPGVLPVADYFENPGESEKRFNAMLSENRWGNGSMKSVCQICEQFSILPSSDFHFGLMTGSESSVVLISSSPKGQRVLKDRSLDGSVSLSDWENGIESIRQERKKERTKRFREVQSMVEGFDGLLKTFARCIGCHNCQSACPICYCRHCYFGSEASKLDSDFILKKAEQRGGLSFPLDRRMFHVGRMSHMSLSCVACGLCSDACPVSIPVADVFSFVADQTQRTFDYKAGEKREEPLPIRQYRLEEIKGVEEWVKDAEGVES
ncbi:hypothetical protein JW824_04420 [bacterium]|nr:hypothetical protein [bacterium]